MAVAYQYLLPELGYINEVPGNDYLVVEGGFYNTQAYLQLGAGTANGVTTVSGVGVAGTLGVGTANGLTTAVGYGLQGANGAGTANGLSTAAGYGYASTSGAGVANGNTNVVGAGGDLGQLYIAEIGNLNLYIEEEVSLPVVPPLIFALGTGTANGIATVLGNIIPGDDNTFNFVAII